MTKAKNPQLHRNTVAEHGFLLLEGPPVPKGASLAGSSSSYQATKAEGGKVENEGQVAELGQFEDEFGVFDQVNLSKDPSGDWVTPT